MNIAVSRNFGENDFPLTVTAALSMSPLFWDSKSVPFSPRLFQKLAPPGTSEIDDDDNDLPHFMGADRK